MDDDAIADEEWLEQLCISFNDERVLGIGGTITPLWNDAPPNKDVLLAPAIPYKCHRPCKVMLRSNQSTMTPLEDWRTPNTRDPVALEKYKKYMSISIQQQKIPILMYHSISDTRNRKFQPFAVPPQAFAEQMKYLHLHGYVPMTVTQFILACTNNEIALPARPVVLTFDDGFADFLTNALPILQRYKFTATLYITTAYIGGTSRWLHREGEEIRPMLTWDQVKYIHQIGIECGGHTLHHPQLDMLSIAEARNEIVSCKSVLEEYLGQEITSFAYPFGYYTTEVRRLVHEAGYVSACAVKHRLSSERSDPLELARLMVKPETTIDMFGQLLTGTGLSQIETIYLRTRTPIWHLVRRGSSFAARQLRGRN